MEEGGDLQPNPVQNSSEITGATVQAHKGDALRTDDTPRQVIN